MLEYIKKSIEKSIETKKSLLVEENINKIEIIANKCIEALKNNNKILFCGNGGSAADAQHLSAELSGRFEFDREPLDAEALHVNTSYLTAVANDYSYDEVFSRLIKAKGKAGDVLIGLSTSGNSKNIIKAFEVCKQKNITTIALTGAKNNKLENIADICLKTSSHDTARIQETHILIGHIICGLIEQGLFNDIRN